MFCVEACSFTPFLALDHNASDREALISRLIAECDLSINDVSPRWHGGTSFRERARRFRQRTDRLPRYNSPYELGRFLARKRIDGGEVQGDHGPAALMITDRDHDTVGRYFSDVRNRGCQFYRNTEEMVDHVRTWLNPKLIARTGGSNAPQSSTIVLEYARFRHFAVRSGYENWVRQPARYFFDLQREMNRWLRNRPAPP
jgi:hypothetical protein